MDNTRIYARKVAEATGLSEAEIYRRHSDDMGSPGHFGFAGAIFYTPKGLTRLVEILDAEGQHVAARCLAAALNQLRSPHGSWAQRWEAAA